MKHMTGQRDREWNRGIQNLVKRVGTGVPEKRGMKMGQMDSDIKTGPCGENRVSNEEYRKGEYQQREGTTLKWTETWVTWEDIDKGKWASHG